MAPEPERDDGQEHPVTLGPGAREVRRILVCYDGSAESERALARAADIASAATSEVTVVSVAEPLYPMRPYTSFADPAEEELHRRLLDDATHTLARDEITAATLEPVVAHGRGDRRRGAPDAGPT
jgi:nucleotide-binding universal stress UspA family protein